METLNSLENSKDCVRSSVSRHFSGIQELFVIAGPCSVDTQQQCHQSINGELIRTFDNNGRLLLEENRLLGEVSVSEQVGVVHRLAVSKPRTSKQTWRGLVHSSSANALALLDAASTGQLPIAVEIVEPKHQELLAHSDVFWLGARSIDNSALHELVVGNPRKPAIIKNGIDEDTDLAIRTAHELFDKRLMTWGGISEPVLFMHRGGVSKTPKQWEDSLRTASDTARRIGNTPMVVDLSHGAELAHRPERETEKSTTGQLAAMEHILELLSSGVLPNVVGVMIESSDINPIEHHKTDPNVTFSDGVQFMSEIARINRHNRTKILDNIPLEERRQSAWRVAILETATIFDEWVTTTDRIND